MNRTWMQNMIKAIVMALAIILMLTNSLVIYATDISNEYIEFVPPEGVDYSDDTVLVAFTNKVSLRFDDYSPEDFKEIKCKSVSDLCKISGAQIKQIIENIALHVTKAFLLK